jgi:hypothetical protein
MKKHTKQIVSGVILFIFGAMVIPTVFCVIAFMYSWANQPLARFVIPGSTFVTVEKESRYYLWNDYRTIYEGKTYSCSEDFPSGLEISLCATELLHESPLEMTMGDPVEFVSDQSITSSVGDSHQNSVGYFEVHEPGSYLLSVSGETGSRVCSFGTSIFNLRNVLIFLATFAVTMVTGLAGFLLVIIGILNLAKSRKSHPDAEATPA